MYPLIFSNPTTSYAAARKIRGEPAKSQRTMIFEKIKAAGVNGLTRDQIEHETGIGGDSVRPRIKELKAEHRVTESGEQRATGSGRAAMVLVAVGAP